MINLRVGSAICKLLEIDSGLVTDISLETHVNGQCFLTLTRRLTEGEVKHLESIVKSHEDKE